MNNDKTLAKNSEKTLGHPLSEIPPLIKTRLKRIESEREQFDQITLEDKREIGELLLEARDQLAHGQWSPWLKKNFQWSQSTATRYMQLGEIRRPTNLKNTTFADIIREHVNPNYDKRTRGVEPEWKEWVKAQVKQAKRIDVETATSRREHEEIIGRMCNRIVNIGYKVLAVELHPDKQGGSDEKMKCLNEARETLRFLLKQAH
jgi:hypothetical protein